VLRGSPVLRAIAAAEAEPPNKINFDGLLKAVTPVAGRKKLDERIPMVYFLPIVEILALVILRVP
jgi:hypothetical protein